MRIRHLLPVVALLLLAGCTAQPQAASPTPAAGPSPSPSASPSAPPSPTPAGSRSLEQKVKSAALSRADDPAFDKGMPTRDGDKVLGCHRALVQRWLDTRDDQHPVAPTHRVEWQTFGTGSAGQRIYGFAEEDRAVAFAADVAKALRTCPPGSDTAQSGWKATVSPVSGTIEGLAADQAVCFRTVRHDAGVEFGCVAWLRSQGLVTLPQAVAPSQEEAQRSLGLLVRHAKTRLATAAGA